MTTSVIKALPGKLHIKRHSPCILYIWASLAISKSVLKVLPSKLHIKVSHLVFSISQQASRCQQAFTKPFLVNFISKVLYISASLQKSTSIPKALPGKLHIIRHSPSILYISLHVCVYIIFSLYTAWRSLLSIIGRLHCTLRIEE